MARSRLQECAGAGGVAGAVRRLADEKLSGEYKDQRGGESRSRLRCALAQRFASSERPFRAAKRLILGGPASPSRRILLWLATGRSLPSQTRSRFPARHPDFRAQVETETINRSHLRPHAYQCRQTNLRAGCAHSYVRRLFGRSCTSWQWRKKAGSKYSAISPIPNPRVYLTGREPVIRISTSLLALCCQSGLDATWETPISARSRSNGSRSLRMSPLLIARFTRLSIAP
jgi:hypothetical protein